MKELRKKLICLKSWRIWEPSRFWWSSLCWYLKWRNRFNMLKRIFYRLMIPLIMMMFQKLLMDSPLMINLEPMNLFQQTIPNPFKRIYKRTLWPRERARKKKKKERSYTWLTLIKKIRWWWLLTCLRKVRLLTLRILQLSRFKDGIESIYQKIKWTLSIESTSRVHRVMNLLYFQTMEERKSLCKNFYHR